MQCDMNKTHFMSHRQHLVSLNALLDIRYSSRGGGEYDLKSPKRVIIGSSRQKRIRFPFKWGGGVAPREDIDPWLARAEFLNDRLWRDHGVEGMALGFGRFGTGTYDITIPARYAITYRDSVRLFRLEWEEWRHLLKDVLAAGQLLENRLRKRYDPAKIARLLRRSCT